MHFRMIYHSHPDNAHASCLRENAEALRVIEQKSQNSWKVRNVLCLNLHERSGTLNLQLVIVLTEAAPALFVKWSGEYFLK